MINVIWLYRKYFSQGKYFPRHGKNTCRENPGGMLTKIRNFTDKLGNKFKIIVFRV